MQREAIVEKVTRLDKFLSTLDDTKRVNEESIHQLRITARELFALVAKGTPLYKEIKKVIKKTNTIRDLDVFLSYFLPIIKQKNFPRNTIKQIRKIILKKRAKRITKFLKVLQTIEFSIDHVTVAQSEDKMKEETPLIIELKHLTLDQKVLHNFRIGMKKMLYSYKHLYPNRIKKIKRLKKIKDELGFINDNYNGLALLNEFLTKNLLLKRIERIMAKRNQRHLERIKILYQNL